VVEERGGTCSLPDGGGGRAQERRERKLHGACSVQAWGKGCLAPLSPCLNPCPLSPCLNPCLSAGVGVGGSRVAGRVRCSWSNEGSMSRQGLRKGERGLVLGAHSETAVPPRPAS